MTATRRRALMLTAALVVTGILGLGALSKLMDHAAEIGEESRQGDNLRLLVALLNAGDDLQEIKGLYGKNVVLSLVANGRLDPANPRELALLFRCGAVPAGIDASSYAEVTLESLRTRRFPRLTDIMGPDRDSPLSRGVTPELQVGRALLAVEITRGLIVGFTAGDVRLMSTEVLRLDDGAASGDGAPAWRTLGLSDE